MFNAVSTAIKSFSGDGAVLTLTFVNGRTYQYFGVDMSEFMRLASAESRGKFFNRNIRNNPAITYAEVK